VVTALVLISCLSQASFFSKDLIENFNISLAWVYGSI